MLLLYFYLITIFFPFLFVESFASITCEGLVLVDKESDLLESRELSCVNGFYTRGIGIPGGKDSLEKALRSVYFNQPLNEQTIKNIKTAIHLYYQKHNCSLILVTVPEQKITKGILQLVVTKSRLGELEFEGNKWTSPQLLKRYMNLQPGEEIDTNEVSQSINFINNNPFRHVNLVYRPGKEARTTDITLLTEEKFPFRFYCGGDNTGIEFTGRQRMLAGFTWGKVLGLDHIFSCQWTVSPDTKKFQAITAQYMALFSNHHILNLYGGYSHLHVPSIDFHNHGTSAQGSLRYAIPFKTRETLAQNTSWGFDYKRLESTLVFNVAAVNFQKNLNLTQLVGTYSGGYKVNSLQLDFGAELFCSPGRWLPDQTKRDFDSQRAGAKSSWVYAKGEFKCLKKIPHDFSFIASFRMQGTWNILPPSEQLGIGGYDTVRGYEERQYNADQGIIANVEFRAPSFSFSKARKDSLQFLGFIDYGYGHDQYLEPGQSKKTYLLGAGPGVRYTIDPYLSCRCDLGVKLHNPDGIFPSGKYMVHFSVVGSF